MPLKHLKTIEDFWKKVDVKGPNDCWEWNKNRQSFGYGNFNGTQASRWIYQYVNDVKLPRKIVVCHLCDNPPCCNPNHLWAGTQSDNMKDMQMKNRNTKGETNGMSVLNNNQVRKIRADNRKQKIIALDYNVTPATISRIKNQLIWKHI